MRSNRTKLLAALGAAVLLGYLNHLTRSDYLDDEEQGRRRLQINLGSLLGFTKITGPALCWLGVDLTRLLGGDLNALVPGDDFGGLDITSLLGSCVCKDYQLERIIATATTARVNVELCAGTIRVQKPFDLTNKNVGFTCITPALFACGFSGLERSSIFTGAPIRATFRQTKFTRGSKAIDFTGGDITLTNVGFVNNVGRMGSAISMTGGGSLTIREGTFRSNKATGNAPFGAGAIFLKNATLTMEDGGGFFENESNGNGGAILAINSTLNLKDITFEGNVAGGRGDAIAIFGSDVDLEGTTFAYSKYGKYKYKNNKHLRFLAKDEKEDDHYSNDDYYNDDDYRDDYYKKSNKYDKDRDQDRDRFSDDFVQHHFERYGRLNDENLEFSGSGNLIFIGDDEDPALTGSFVDCDATTQPLFCGGIDITQVGDTFNNTNCPENALGADSSECRSLKYK